MFEQIVTEAAEVGEHPDVFRSGALGCGVVVGQDGDALVPFYFVAVVRHHRIDGVLDGPAVEGGVLLSQLRGAVQFEDEREEHVLLLLAVYVKVGHAVAEVVRRTLQLGVSGSERGQSAEQLPAVFACVAVMELEYVVYKQVKIPGLEGDRRFKFFL